MEIYLRTEKSIIKMNEILEVNGKFLIMASLDRKQQCVVCQYSSEERAKNVLNHIDAMLTRQMQNNSRILMLEIPKD